MSAQVPSTFGSTVLINLKFLIAGGFGWISWKVWPTTPEWWGLSVVSTMAGLGAASLALDAIKLMIRVYQRDRELYGYHALGHEPKFSKLASKDELDKAGMR